MSTLKTTNLQNPSSASVNIGLGTDGSVSTPKLRVDGDVGIGTTFSYRLLGQPASNYSVSLSNWTPLIWGSGITTSLSITTNLFNNAYIDQRYPGASIQLRTEVVSGNAYYNLTLLNGATLVGGGTSTGTANQPLQVNGGGYFSYLVGIGTTNPNARLEVSGPDNWNYPLLSLKRSQSNVNTARFITFPLGGDVAFDPTTSYGQLPTIGVNYSGAPGIGSTSVGLNASLYFATPSNLQFYTDNAERMRIDNAGRLLVGTTTSVSTNKIQIFNSGIDITSYSADQFAYGNLFLRKSRGTTVGSNTIVLANDELGGIYFVGADGSSQVYAASIRGDVDGTPGTNDMPGRLVFSTTLDGASTPTERMRIDSNGFVSCTGSIGRGAPVTKTGNFTLGIAENWVICNGTATITVTLPTASAWTGREVMLKTIAAFTVVSASSNVVPLVGGAAGTAILAATAGKYATLVSDGTNWIIMQAN